MYNFIGIEYVASNAIIQLLEKSGEKQISFSMINNYGLRIEELVSKSTNERAVFVFDKTTIDNFFIDYSKYFKVIKCKDTDEQFLELESGYKLDDLKEIFLWNAPYEIYKALVSEESLAFLGIVA